MALTRCGRWRASLAASLIVCAASAPSPAARADGEPARASDAEHAAAVGSFHRGTQLVEAGKLEEAIDAFREALQHEPGSVGARLDLADCYEKVGSPSSAWRQYAVAEIYARKESDPRQAMAQTSSAQLERRLFVVTLAGPRPEGMDLRIDGDSVEPEILGRGALAVAPGQHRFELTAPRKLPLARALSGAAGETRTLALVFEDEASATPREAREKSGGAASAQRTWGFVLGGVGLAGVAAGSILGGLALSKRSTLETESHDPSVTSGQFYADRSSTDGLATGSTAAFIAGGALLAGGVALVLTAHSPRGRAIRLVVGPSIGLARGGEMTLGGAF